MTPTIVRTNLSRLPTIAVQCPPRKLLRVPFFSAPGPIGGFGHFLLKWDGIMYKVTGIWRPTLKWARSTNKWAKKFFEGVIEDDGEGD